MTLVDDFLEHVGAVETPAPSTQCAVMALPREMDPIRLVGPEDKHATLLYFGETANMPDDAKTNLINLLTQASRIFFPFREYVQSVDRLGEEEPPALVAMLSNDNLGKIREALKLNTNVVEYLKNAKQYPQFTPHVTFGYPTYQEEKLLKEKARQIGRVQFDRLALWWNDERYIFDLDTYPQASPQTSDEDFVAYADDFDEFIAQFDDWDNVVEHFGIKGMRWGVRRSDSELARARSGGGKQPASEDAIKAVTSAAKVKSAGTLNVLSSKELKDLVERMNLEQSYVKLTTPTNQATQQKGDGLIKKIFKNEVTHLQSKGTISPGAQLLADILSNKSTPSLAVGYTGAGKRKLGVPIAKKK